MHSLPCGENKLASLSEFTVTETKTRLRFKDLAIGTEFWLPDNRQFYRKLADDRVEALKPEYEYERHLTVTDVDFIVEL